MLKALRQRLDGRHMGDETIRRKPFTTGEVAEILDVSQRTVIRLCDAGELKHYWSRGGGKRLIRKRDLDAYITRTS